MKKLAAILLCVLLACALVVSVQAAGNTSMTITPETSSVQPGQEVAFTVTVTGTEVVTQYGLMLTYDTSVFELTGGSCTVEDATIYDFNNGFAVLYSPAKVPSGTVGTFTLRVKEDAALGDTTVSGTPAAKNGVLTLASSVTGAKVTVVCSHTGGKATCNEAAICETCGQSYGEANGHSLNEVAAKAATCTEPGNNKYYTCANCDIIFKEDGKTETTIEAETLAASGHSWTDSVCGGCGAVCSSHSYESGVCTVCGKLQPGITFGRPTLSLESEVLYNFYFTTTDIEGVELEDMGLLTWSTRPENGTIDNAEQNFPGAVFNSSGNNYMVRTGGIPAKNMGDKLYVRIYAKLADGTYVYSALGYYSARVYAEDRIANSSNANLKSLCVALLNYGAAAQTYFGYRTDDLMNAGISAYQNLVTDYSESMVSALPTVDSTKTEAFTYNGGYKGYYSSASLEGALGCNIYFVPNTAMDGDMTVYFWDKATYDSAAALTAENAAYVKTAAASATAGHYGASFPGIPAKKVDETIFACAVYTSGGVTYCSGVRPISLGQYCADRAANGSEKMQPLAEAIVVYGHYADSYFAN